MPDVGSGDGSEPEIIMDTTEQNIELRERSGRVISNDKLVSFLYDLIKCHLPARVVESLVREAQYDGEFLFTNGYLANYCKDLAERLK